MFARPYTIAAKTKQNVKKMATPIMAAITFLRAYFIRTKRTMVKPRMMARKIKGFATDSGSSKATRPADWTGAASRRAPSSTMTKKIGMTRTGRASLRRASVVSMKYRLLILNES